jgi:hypothetical protein
MAETELLTVGMIRVDGGTQTRAKLDDDHVQTLADLLASGAKFDNAPIVFYDGSEYWLADGFHRIAAHKRANIHAVNCSVRQGALRDAILFSVGANDEHRGLRRTNADKRRAVEMLLRDAEWQKKSDRWVAEQCRVGKTMVLAMRAELVAKTDSIPLAESVETSDGRNYTKPGKATAPGAERKRKTPTPPPVEQEEVEFEVVEFEPIHENPAEPLPRVVIEQPQPERLPLPPIDTRAPLLLAWDRAGHNERLALLSHVGAVQSSALDRLVSQRNSDTDVKSRRDRENDIYPPGDRSRALAFYDFVLSGGDVALGALGLDYLSTLDELKTNYRRESMRHHPDKGGSPERMAAINAAHALVKRFFEEIGQ